MYSSIIININCFNIMVTLGVYFEHIQIVCNIFIKYIVSILQVYQSYLIIRLKFITKEIYYYIILYYVYFLITYNNKYEF